MNANDISQDMNCYPLIALALILLAFTGCSPHKQYSASEVRAEYGNVSDAMSYSVSDSKHQSSDITPPAKDIESGLPESLTLSQIIDISVANNPNLQQAVHRIAQAKAMKDLSDSTFWPAVGFYTEYMQGDAPSAYLFKTIDQRKLPQDINFNDPGWFENYETGISARINIFNGGRDYLGLLMAEQDVDISGLEQKTVVNNLKAQVIGAFYDVLAAGKFVGIAEESVATVSEQLRIIKVQYSGGGALKSEVLTLAVRLAQAKELLVESQRRYKLSKAALTNLMGLDPDGLLGKLESVVQKEAISTSIDVPETYEEGLIYALSHRPELEKTRKQLVKSRMGLDVSKSDYLPRIDLMGKYYVDDEHMDYASDRENWTSAVVLNWDLFTGLSSGARVNKADAIVREMLAVDRQVVLGIKLDVKNAYLNLEAAQARYDVAASSVENAEESYRLVQVHYKGGSVTITRYLEAELDRNRSRIRSTAAYYDKIKANAEFARAIGKWAGPNQQNLER